ncbi:hypothetical protein PAHAL_6G074300 [Panicum hallii]|jgi:speckle-type POZ protein|uniref:BTB domain-containing protein n=1 Tax=Panicum hallii TaxID=206008 RepID=A0A2S3I182_9POAL|nr:BTB/POZ and MATH domain-containing protein 1-like [Panicum hallii]PAN34180.1 hypothetical protein PAHAL_6G074300 [Panicum hallii]
MGNQSKKTASRCTTEAETGIHRFEIIGYNLKRGIGIGNFFQSDTFTVGDHNWAIRFYPDGVSKGTKMFVAISLELMTNDAEVRACYNLFLVNQDSGHSESIMSLHSTAIPFESHNYFVARENKLEAGCYVRDDCLTIECYLTVIKASQLCKIKGGLEIQVPPSDLSEHFGRLFLEEEGADVIFMVRGERFLAHKIVLATRSPVFKAQLSYGQMETTAHCVPVEDMQPVVFKALLNFIYTDALPDSFDDLDEEDYSEVIKHLLAAADIYAMDRLKLLCGSILVKHLRVETVATTLAIADQHNCESLKQICIEFMASSDKMDAVVATQGYANLKRTCPSILVDVLEKRSRRCKA